MVSKQSPYAELPAEAFWRNGVAGSGSIPAGMYRRKWPIRKTELVGTAGSCFAQHIGRHLRSSGFNVIDVEPPPEGLAAAEHGRFGYAMYSARYGNLYTARQLRELAEEAFEIRPASDLVWERDGRFFDALRPNVEPYGLASREEVLFHRAHHLRRVREMLLTLDVFVFTLGLTEAWIDIASGNVLPTAPGTIAGEYDPDRYRFVNFSFADVLADFMAFRELVRAQKQTAPRFLLTVSPVPLTATYSGQHVMTATMHSKSILRTVAGQLSHEFSDVDYFPSYEIVMSPWRSECFFEPNMRSVKASSVEAVMKTFLAAHGEEVEAETSALAAESVPAPLFDDDADRVICEEELLDAFGARP